MTTLQKLMGAMFAVALVAGCSSQQQQVEDTAGADTGAVDTSTGSDTGSASWDSLAAQYGNVVYFEFDSYAILPASEVVLGAYSELLKSTNDNAVLEGHADERGTREYNMALGEKRGNAARDYLTLQGVNASQLEVVSYGEERPAVAESNEAAYSKNRRVEIIKQ